MTNTSQHEVVVVDADDWNGIYIDGECVYNDHPTHRAEDILQLVQDLGSFTVSTRYDVDINWLHSVGAFPDRLEDVKFQ